MSRVVVRPATLADIEAFIGPPPCRIRALTAEIDGRIIGIGGLCYLPSGDVGIFSTLTDEFRQHKFALHRAGLLLMRMAREMGLKRIVGLLDETRADVSARWLERLGFQRRENGLYEWAP
jgi:N-acetylglutamate synthase-like GNAT family acetyltransferase